MFYRVLIAHEFYHLQAVEKKWNGFYGKKVCFTEDKHEIIYFFTFGSSCKYFRMLERWVNIVQLMLYLIALPKDDIAAFYHERYFRFAMNFCMLFLTKFNVYSLPIHLNMNFL